MFSTKKKSYRKKSSTKKTILHKAFPRDPFIKEKRACCSIRFYDNQTDIVKQFMISKPLVEVVQVAADPFLPLTQTMDTTQYIHYFLKENPKNPYAQYLYQMGIRNNDTAIGFSVEKGEDLKRWVKEKRGEKAVLFDWDRTLSVLEGIVVPPNQWVAQEFKQRRIVAKDIALYYAGTRERLKYIRLLSAFLDKHKVHVYILTNNPVASTQWSQWRDSVGPESRDQFFRVVRQFFPSIKIENILSGMDTNGFKPDVFNKHPILRYMYERMEHWEYMKQRESGLILK